MRNPAPFAFSGSLPAATASYHVVGLGFGPGDLRYIGWTQRSVPEEARQILSDLVGNALAAIVTSMGAQADVFEIESFPTQQEAVASALGLCAYFNSLGLDVTFGS